MTEISFETLKLSKTTLKAIAKKNFKFASEIQAKIIPLIFEGKKDVIGVAQTGTGKTGAFGLPLVDLINKGNKVPQALILAPTRELALQVTSELNFFAGEKRLKILCVYGGASMATQIKALKEGVDIVVGTHGRIVDLINRKELKLSAVQYLVLDEADEMLKMGFIEDLEFIFEQTSPKRRVYLFSATMPERIKNLSKKYMHKQEYIEVKRNETTSLNIEQSFYKVKQSEKFEALAKIIASEKFFYGIIFCRTKADVDTIASKLRRVSSGVASIHGDVPQRKREKLLEKFRKQDLQILVATDVAARGIDVENLTHVINFNLPEDLETYTHRIGRTGRAGKKGKAVSLVTPAELRRISILEKGLKTKIACKKLEGKANLENLREKNLSFEIEKLLERTQGEEYFSLAEELVKNYPPFKVVAALLQDRERNKR
ncbi:MAG: DEAD/DEAH box helicase [Nanoarchaeota archaeon]|nr:DEAD/DEAH box helicase [Nanoarchaeota archaeon]